MEKNSYTIDFDLKNNPSETLRDINGLLVEIQKSTRTMSLKSYKKIEKIASAGNAYFCFAFAFFCSSFSSLFRSFSFIFCSSRCRRASSFFFLFSSFCRRITSCICAMCSSNWRISSLRRRLLSAPLTLLSCSFLASHPYFSGSSGSFFFSFLELNLTRPKVTRVTRLSRSQHPRKMDKMTKTTIYPIVLQSY